MRRALAASFVVVVGSSGCRERPPTSINPPPSHETRVIDGECRRVPYGSSWEEQGTIVDCPESMITRREDGTCWYEPSTSCPNPELMTCNPPPPKLVRCPGTSDAGTETADPAANDATPSDDAAPSTQPSGLPM